jgi:hypothetical protein
MERAGPFSCLQSSCLSAAIGENRAAERNDPAGQVDCGAGERELPFALIYSGPMLPIGEEAVKPCCSGQLA